MRLLFVKMFLFSVLAFAHFGYAQKDLSTRAKIESYLSALETAGFHGTVLIELPDGSVLSQGYGYRNIQAQLKNTPATVFDIGSLTKQFTATAILLLEVQGKLSTADALLKFFPDVPKDKAHITIHDLLRHQSGLTSNVGKDYESISEEDFLYKVLSSGLRFEPGAAFSYSNVGYSLLAMIIEKVSGQDYETFLYENIWRPAQMEMTGYSRPAFDTSLIAIGYTRDDVAWGKPTDKAWDHTAPYWHLKGNGGLLSTTGDLYKWHRCLMTDLVLPTEARQKLYHPVLRAEETEASYYAYGWDVFMTSRNTLRIWHNGTNQIFYADFLRFVDENATLIMMSNKSNPNFEALCFDISHMIFNPAFEPQIPVADIEENRIFTHQIIQVIASQGFEKAKLGYGKRKPGEGLIEYMMRNEGFSYLDNGRPDVAIDIFAMNVFAHPQSAKALQDLGEVYMETGNNELALKYFKESFDINPEHPFVNAMIKKLEK